jgi:Glycosyltransferase
MKKILVIANYDDFYNTRAELVEKLLQHFKVYISYPVGPNAEKFIKMGAAFIDTPIDRRGTNIFHDFKLLNTYKRLINEVKPDIVLTFSIKPNIYAGVLCRFFNIPYIANITGLGTAIANSGFTQKLALLLYKIGLKASNCVFFQNIPNSELFLRKKIVRNNARIIPGSGVNITVHKYEEYPDNDESIRFLFIGRIMKDKGIEEFLIAARRVKEIYPNTCFDLIGILEEDYSDILYKLMEEGIINYVGSQSDVHRFIKNSHATVLPSYHEGTSNVLLETASTGRPVIASNVTGCKETFDEGISGLGFEAKNVDDLVETLITFIKFPLEQKKAMGIAGRNKMEKEFDRSIVVNAYWDEINKIANI